MNPLNLFSRSFLINLSIVIICNLWSRIIYHPENNVTNTQRSQSQAVGLATRLKLSAQPYGQPNAKYVHFCTCTRYLMCT